MTIETAIRAKEIVTELESLSAKRDLFENYDGLNYKIEELKLELARM